MSTFFAYLIENLPGNVGAIPEESFDLLAEAQKASKDGLIQALEEHCAAEVSDPLDPDPIFSMCAPENEGGELDLWVFKMLTGTDNCIGVFPHAMPTLADHQVWTYEI